MTHKIAVYLQEHFSALSVDCEYNKNGILPKTLIRNLHAEVREDDLNASTVYPDIIIHQGGTSYNLVVIEAKKSGQLTNKDREKLLAFKEQLGYKFAVQMIFDIGRNKDITFEEITS